LKKRRKNDKHIMSYRLNGLKKIAHSPKDH